jgi:hypothetical protein
VYRIVSSLEAYHVRLNDKHNDEINTVPFTTSATFRYMVDIWWIHGDEVSIHSCQTCRSFRCRQAVFTMPSTNATTTFLPSFPEQTFHTYQKEASRRHHFREAGGASDLRARLLLSKQFDRSRMGDEWLNGCLPLHCRAATVQVACCRRRP